MKKQRIFVSGVQKELEVERLAIKELVTQNALLKRYFSIFLFEDLSARSKSARRTYLEEVAQSDVLVLLLGREYGATDSDGLSATENEFRKAVEHDLKILAFIKRENRSARDRRVRKLMKEIERPESGYVYKKFDDTSELKEHVYNSLLMLLEEDGFLRKAPFDAMISEEVAYDDINEELVRDFLANRAIKRKVAVPKVPIKDLLLRTLKVVEKRKGVLKPTNTALLFFCDSPQRFIPQSTVKIARFRGNARIEFIDSQEFEGPLYGMLEDAEKFFTRNTRLASKIVEFKRVDIPEYPFEAIREAIVNAAAHRDYNRIGSNIQIDIFDDRVEVTSPGRLLRGLDIKNLEGVHETRNREICRIFHETKDMERYGTGITKMKDWMIEHGLEPPILSQPGDFFRVTFSGPGERILDLVSDVPEERRTDLRELGLNERQIEALRLMVNQKESMSTKKYCQMLKVSRSTAYLDLAGLVTQEMIVPEGRGRSRYYVAI